MFHSSPALWLALLAAGPVGSAWAQAAPAPAAYRSAFEGYQPFTDVKPQSWKAANDTVGRIGGWRAYAREAAEAPAPGAAAPASAAVPAPAKAPATAPAVRHQH